MAFLALVSWATIWLENQLPLLKPSIEILHKASCLPWLLFGLGESSFPKPVLESWAMPKVESKSMLYERRGQSANPTEIHCPQLPETNCWVGGGIIWMESSKGTWILLPKLEDDWLWKSTPVRLQCACSGTLGQRWECNHWTAPSPGKQWNSSCGQRSICIKADMPQETNEWKW